MKQVFEWISTNETERLPDELQRVLIVPVDAASSDDVTEACRLGDYDSSDGWVWTNFDGGNWAQSEVTHWMPKPELPVKE